MNLLQKFFKNVKKPFLILSAIPVNDRNTVANFLVRLNAPVYIEGLSGLREDPRLRHLRITCLRNIWELPLDGVFRIGGVPTHRIWRDLEQKKEKVRLLSFSHLPWQGATWGEVIHSDYNALNQMEFNYPELWFSEPAHLKESTSQLFQQYPLSEPALINRISEKIPEKSLIYLGNSLPIREWDLAATDTFKQHDIYASRGMNGIDGQLSTFLGMTQPFRSNWCILGDLTALYDMAAPWILDQLEPRDITFVVINNGGGMIFARMSKNECLQNRHSLRFDHFAKLWKMDYFGEEGLDIKPEGVRLIELIPCAQQTEQFWDAYGLLKQSMPMRKHQYA